MCGGGGDDNDNNNTSDKITQTERLRGPGRRDEAPPPPRPVGLILAWPPHYQYIILPLSVAQILYAHRTGARTNGLDVYYVCIHCICMYVYI